ncbi:MAG: fumarylacetoacetate hydrolase family protein [Pseudomonadota bacterium]
MQWIDNSPVGFSPSKIICVGRNYREHAIELGNAVPESPLLFLKPPSAIQCVENSVWVPTQHGPVSYECEIALLIGKTLTHVTAEEAKTAIIGVTLALDFTLRDLQNELKKQGYPWEKAKAFDGACALNTWVPWSDKYVELNLGFFCAGQKKQEGSSSQMMWPIAKLIAEASKWFTLQPGDVILTGTPEGVGLMPEGEVQWKLSIKNKDSEINVHEWSAICRKNRDSML